MVTFAVDTPAEFRLTDALTQFREFILLDRKNRTDGLTTADIERWMQLKRALGKRFSPGLNDARADERESVRVPTPLRVDLASVEALRDQRMTNFSRGGLFVATAHLLEIGTRVRLFITIDAVSERLEIPAEVVSHNVGPHFEPDARGMRLRFLEIDAAACEKLEALYEDSLQRATRELQQE